MKFFLTLTILAAATVGLYEALPSPYDILLQDKLERVKNYIELKAQAADSSDQQDGYPEVPHELLRQSTSSTASDVPFGPQPEQPTKAELDENLEINRITLEYADQSFSADDILNDKLNLLPESFKIPAGIKTRVGFWLDIYTKYSSHFSIIHDAVRPWIIYRVVDLRPIYEGPGNRFTKAANDHSAVIKARNEVRKTLNKLAHLNSYSNLNGEEYKIFKLLEAVPGSRHKVFNLAARSVRDQRGQKDFFKKGIVSSSRYINDMENIFAHYDLPVELVRLPLVESSFNEGATSKVGASGIWQFMRGMGKHYLRVGQVIDERDSPLKATEAAARLMQSNFQILKSWPLAVTAYNHGAGGIAHACRQLKTNSLADIIEKYKSHSFSFASENFYSEFLAALYGEKYQEQIFGAMVKYEPLSGDLVEMKYSMRAKTLVDLVGMTVEELKLYNPDLKSQAISGATYLPVGLKVRLPFGKKATLDLFDKQADDARLLMHNRFHSGKHKVNPHEV